MSVRAYDPALGRFLSRDPLGRVPLYFSEQPYVYAGNNPLVYVDPSGERRDPNDVRHVNLPPIPPKSGKRIQSANKGEGAPRDAAWASEDPDHRYTIWIGKIDKPDGGTVFTHINLHIRTYRSKVDLFNFHIWYFGFDGVNDVWYWRNFVPGVSEHEKEHEIDRVAPYLPDVWAVEGAINTILDALEERSGVHILYTITNHVDRSGVPGGKSLSDALQESLIALRDRWWREAGMH